MSNINGKVYAMNVVTPMKPWKTPILRLLFFIIIILGFRPQEDAEYPQQGRQGRGENKEGGEKEES